MMKLNKACELYYHSADNMLYEIISLYKNTAVIQRYCAGNRDYCIVTKPLIKNENISWHLKFEVTGSKNNISTYAKGMSDIMAKFKSPVDINEVCNIIKDAVSNNFDGYSIETEAAIDQILNNCSADELKTVLALHLDNHSYDGRIKRENKAWAAEYISENNIDIKQRKYVNLNTSTGLLDLLVDDAKNLNDEDKTLDLTKKNSGRK